MISEELQPTQDAPNRTKPCCGGNRIAILIALIAAFLLGVSTRPAWHWLRPQLQTPKTAQPILPAYYHTKAEQFATLDKQVGPGAVVFLGDSITDWIACEQLLESDQGTIVNRGISGDTTTGVLERIKTSFPSDTIVCVVMIGINDLIAGVPADNVAAITKQIATLLAEEHNVTTVVLESVLPTNRAERSKIDKVNEQLRAYAAEHDNVEFLDLTPTFCTSDGAQDLRWFVDGIHLNHAGAMRRLTEEIAYVRSLQPQLNLRLRAVPD